MDYLIKNTTKKEREKYVNKALGISLSGADAPSKKAIFLAKEYIDGHIELKEVQKLIIKEYQENE